jgi:hypothetical protein
MRTVTWFSLLASIALSGGAVHAQPNDPFGPGASGPGANRAAAKAARAQARAAGQGPGGPGALTPEKREELRKRIRAMRTWYLTEQLSLDGATAARLFPVLNQYDDRLEAMAERGAQLRRELRRSMAGRQQDPGLNRKTDELLAHFDEAYKLERERFAAVRKVVSPAQAARLLIILPRIDHQIRHQIAMVMRRGRGAGGGGGGDGMRGFGGGGAGRRAGRRSPDQAPGLGDDDESDLDGEGAPLDAPPPRAAKPGRGARGAGAGQRPLDPFGEP